MLKYSPKPVIVGGSLYLRRGGIIISATKYETSMNRPVHSFAWLTTTASRDYVFGGKYKKLEVSRIYVICFKIYSLWKENHDHKIMRANWNIKHNSCLIFDAIWRLAQFWPYFLVMQNQKWRRKFSVRRGSLLYALTSLYQYVLLIKAGSLKRFAVFSMFFYALHPLLLKF